VAVAGGLAAAKAVYDDLSAQLGATQQDLASTEQDLKDADAKAEQADKDAAAAEKQAASADNETDKAKAEADKAQAEATAAESRATVVADCAKAYFSAFGSLFEGDDVRAQAAKVREQLKGITADCEAALGAA
jgi:chromosome segregation ATPase